MSTARELSPSPEPAVRGPVAVFVSRFPLITETFILREIIELERQNQPVVLVPMLRERPRVIHEEAKPWVRRALYTPHLSKQIILANLKAWLREPRATFRTFTWIFLGAMFRPEVLLKSLSIAPKAIYLAAVLRDMGVAHIHAHFATYPATMARITSMYSGIPYSFTVHAHDIFVDRTLLREKVRDASLIRSISKFNKVFLESLYPDEVADKISVVHVGIEPENYEASPQPFHRPLRILTVAALKPYKGIPALIDACALLAEAGVDFRCDVIGDGPMRGVLKRRIERAGITDRVTLRGPLPQHAVAGAMRDCDIFVLPSIIASDNQMEGIPVALMEAMAAGKPVVATAISGIPELVEDRETGLLVDMANPLQLANAVRTLISDEQLRQRVGAGGRARVARDFSLKSCVASLSRLLGPATEERDGIVVETVSPFAETDGAGVRRIHRRTDSLVIEALASNEGNESAEIILKRQIARTGESRPPRVRAGDEHRLLNALTSHFAGFGGGVPRVIGFDEVHATIAMTRVAGTSLETLIRRSGSSDADALALADAARGAGKWLRRFQEFESGPRQEAIDRLHRRAIRDLDRAGDRLFTFTERRVRQRLNILAEATRSVAGEAVSRHGDLWPGNIFATGERVEVIDFEGYGLSLPGEDLAYFLLHARMYYAFGRRSSHGLDNIERELFAGYGRRIAEVELEFCRMAAATALLASGSGGTSGLQRIIRAAFVRRELSR